MARQALVKNILGEYSGPFAPPPLGPPANTPPLPAHEDYPFKTRDDRHGILGEAEIDIPPVPETRETPGGAVPAQRLLGAREVEIYDLPRPLVEPHAPLPQAAQNGAAADSSSPDLRPYQPHPITATRSP